MPTAKQFSVLFKLLFSQEYSRKLFKFQILLGSNSYTILKVKQLPFKNSLKLLNYFFP